MELMAWSKTIGFLEPIIYYPGISLLDFEIWN